MKVIGHLSYFLGLEVSYDHTGYYLSQMKYATDLLSHVGLTDNKTDNTLLETIVKLYLTNGTILDDPTLYRQLSENLIYLTCTGPDIVYIVHIVS